VIAVVAIAAALLIVWLVVFLVILHRDRGVVVEPAPSPTLQAQLEELARAFRVVSTAISAQLTPAFAKAAKAAQEFGRALDEADRILRSKGEPWQS